MSAAQQANQAFAKRQRAKKASIRFGIRFVAFAGVPMVLVGANYFDNAVTDWAQVVVDPWIRAMAAGAEQCLQAIGYSVVANGVLLDSAGGTVEVKRGCDGLAPIALFASAVLAYPATARARAIGIVTGSVFLSVANLVRIVTLVMCLQHFPEAFEALHLDVWQPLFVLLAGGTWIAWALCLGRVRDVA